MKLLKRVGAFLEKVDHIFGEYAKTIYLQKSPPNSHQPIASIVKGRTLLKYFKLSPQNNKLFHLSGSKKLLDNWRVFWELLFAWKRRDYVSTVGNLRFTKDCVLS